MPFRHIALCLLLLIGVCPKNSIAQNSTDTLAKPPKNTPIPELLWKFDSEGNTYLKATVLSQIWLRWNESNPGSLVYGTQMPQTGDIGLRRMRMQLYGKFSKHLFFYMQYGVNNFNYLAQNAGNRKLHAFFHDVVSEYIVTEGKNSTLKIGGGLTIATGLSRFSQPSIGTILTVDVPVFLQTTTDQIDEFSRELGIYARGQYHKWDYRVVLSHPFPIQTNGGSQPTLGQDATFTTTGEHLQCGTLFIYNLADKEPHTTPYMAGTYLGKKKIINIEAGFIYQPKATWSLPQKNDTQYHNMLHTGIAMYIDMPLKKSKNISCLSAYLGYFNTDYGTNYIRNNGIMNPANGNNITNVFSGAGNAYPMFGTGNSLYAQLGVLYTSHKPNHKLPSLLPYIAYRHSNYQKLSSPVAVLDAGINLMLNDHKAKLTLNYQSRPVFKYESPSVITSKVNNSSAWVQYQLFF